jgi:predicted Zn-dependent protease
MAVTAAGLGARALGSEAPPAGGAPLPPQRAAEAQACPPAIRQRLAAPAQLVPHRLPPGPGYADRLQTTPLGWPRLASWCVWIEPPPSRPAASTAADREQARWQQAVLFAVAHWQTLLPIRLVTDPSAAQVRVWRRRPPLRSTPTGGTRASHGRAQLRLLAVQRQPGRWRLEPAVEVLLSPAQRLEAQQATALHELGHAFGLWGHSGDPADVMAAAPGAVPVLATTARDRTTLHWLLRQPTAFGGTAFGSELAEPPGPGSAGLGGAAVGHQQGPQEAQ